MVYVDDGIFISPEARLIDECIELMQASFNLTDEGNISDYLGIKVTLSADSNSISLTHPHLILPSTGHTDPLLGSSISWKSPLDRILRMRFINALDSPLIPRPPTLWLCGTLSDI